MARKNSKLPLKKSNKKNISLKTFECTTTKKNSKNSYTSACGYFENNVILPVKSVSTDTSVKYCSESQLQKTIFRKLMYYVVPRQKPTTTETNVRSSFNNNKKKIQFTNV